MVCLFRKTHRQVWSYLASKVVIDCTFWNCGWKFKWLRIAPLKYIYVGKEILGMKSCVLSKMFGFHLGSEIKIFCLRLSKLVLQYLVCETESKYLYHYSTNMQLSGKTPQPAERNYTSHRSLQQFSNVSQDKMFWCGSANRNYFYLKNIKSLQVKVMKGSIWIFLPEDFFELWFWT